MISIEEQEKLVGQSFERFEALDKEWVSVDDELALDYMLNHPGYQRRKRSADWLRSILRRPKGDPPKKAPFKYRLQVHAVVLGMQDREEVEFRFLDDKGELPETPSKGNLHSKDRRYRRITEAKAPAEPVPEAA